MLRGRFKEDEFSAGCLDAVRLLTKATIDLWAKTKAKMLPTPAKFFYVFNMRDLSRIFQGILLTPKSSIQSGGSQQKDKLAQEANLVRLLKHEAERVLCDKLTTAADKEWYVKCANKLIREYFGPEIAAKAEADQFFVDFFMDDVYDEDGLLIEEAPKVYEDGTSLQVIRDRTTLYMKQHDEKVQSGKFELILFDDALKHLIRVSRIIGTPRGSGLLVGVGGSGKQSLTRLASYIARSHLFQIKLTKNYNEQALKDDLKIIFEMAGSQGKKVTFLFTDSEIKKEIFLEYINATLMTGSIPGLFAKDEMLAMTADLGTPLEQERGLPPTAENLNAFFTDRVRDNLHVMLCMSPMNPKFPERARKFPGLISCCTIDIFLPWPQEALVSVSDGKLNNGDFELFCTDEEKQQVIEHMGTVHTLVDATCTEYFNRNRRRVYQTPKSYLSFLANYKELYSKKVAEIDAQASNVRTG